MEKKELLFSSSISTLCSLGLFLAGYIFYSSSIIESFYTAEFHLTSWEIGIAQSAVFFGAIIGALVAGRIADLIGRRRLLIWSFLCLIISGILSGLVFNFSSLCLLRITNGALAGTMYPLCAAYLTEMTSRQSLGKQTAIAMFINCSAAPVGCLVAFLFSLFFKDMTLWRVIFSFHAVPAAIAYWYARKLPESQEWLLTEAAKDAKQKVTLTQALAGLKTIFSDEYKQLTLCLIASWFLMDIAYYGINFFIPYLLQAIAINSFSANFANHNTLLNNETLWGTFVINIFFMLGALASVFIIEKVNIINLQKYGLFAASISLFLLAAYFYSGLHYNSLIIILFIFFNVALNAGPGVTTYILSATSYPVTIRGSGHGFISGSAKFGSFLGVLFLPRIQDIWGYQTVILLLAILLFIAFTFTVYLSKIIFVDKINAHGEIVYETN